MFMKFSCFLVALILFSVSSFGNVSADVYSTSSWYKCTTGYITNVLGVENGNFLCSDGNKPQLQDVNSAQAASDYALCRKNLLTSSPMSVTSVPTGVVVIQGSTIPTDFNSDFLKNIQFTCSYPGALDLSNGDGYALVNYSVLSSNIASAMLIQVPPIEATFPATKINSNTFACQNGFLTAISGQGVNCYWNKHAASTLQLGSKVSVAPTTDPLTQSTFCPPNYAAISVSSSISCSPINLASGYQLTAPNTVSNGSPNIDCNRGYLTGFTNAVTNGKPAVSYTCINVIAPDNSLVPLANSQSFATQKQNVAQCYDGSNIPLGRASADNSIRLYTSNECSYLNGIFYQTGTNSGECLVNGGGSWSQNCRALNNFVLSLDSSTPFAIKHSGGLCAQSADGLSLPAVNSTVILRSCSNDNRLQFTFSNGNLIHSNSGSCLMSLTDAPNDSDQVVLGSSLYCSSNRAKFVWLNTGSIQHVASGKCVHQHNGLYNPTDGTYLVFWGICNDAPRISFSPYSQI